MTETEPNVINVADPAKTMEEVGEQPDNMPSKKRA